MSNSHGPSPRGVLHTMQRGVALLLCFIATTGTGGAAGTEVGIRSATLALDAAQDVYELDARTDIRVPEEARKGIEAGLTLRLVYDIELSRVRRFLPDATVAELAQSYELSYHALSQRYLVRNLNTSEQKDYGTLQAALDGLGEVQGLPVIDAGLVEAGPKYEARVRATVDLSATSDALGWLIFWSDDWSASSEWFTWPLHP